MRVIYNKIHPSEAPSGQGFVVALLCESQGSCPSFHCQSVCLDRNPSSPGFSRVAVNTDCPIHKVDSAITQAVAG